MRSEKTDDAQVGIDGGYVRGRLKQGKFALDGGVYFLNAFRQLLRMIVLALEGRCVQSDFKALQLINA